MFFLLSDENEIDEVIYHSNVIAWTKGNQIVLISGKIRGILDEFGNPIKFKDRIFPVIVFALKETSVIRLTTCQVFECAVRVADET